MTNTGSSRAGPGRRDMIHGLGMPWHQCKKLGGSGTCDDPVQPRKGDNVGSTSLL